MNAALPMLTRSERLHAGMLVSARFLYRHSLTLLALLICCAVLTGVDQVSHVVFHLPTVTFASLASLYGWLVLAFWLFVILLLSAYLMFTAYLTPVEANGFVERIGRAMRTKWCSAAVGAATLLCLILTFTGLPGVEDTNLLAGLALGIPIFWLLATIEHPVCEWFVDVPWRFAGAPNQPITSRCGKIAGAALAVLAPILFLRIYGVLDLGGWQPGNGFLGIAIGYCLWILAGRLHHLCWPAHIAHTWRLLRPFGRGLWILLWTNVVGELLWGMAHWQIGAISFRNYSIWCIFHLLFSLVVVARLLDWLAHQTQWPFRFLGFIVGASVIYLVSVSAHVGSPGTTATSVPESNETKTAAWLSALAERIEQCPADKPVLVVAASGGGSRAALFAALVYESLARLPVASSDGSRRLWADQIVLISSVSGGSLASAYFCSQPFPVPAVRPMRPWEHSLTHEIQAWLPKKVKQFRDKLQNQADSATEEVVRMSLEMDIQLWNEIEAKSQTLAALSSSELLAADNPHAWLLRNGFADDMCTDFMAPLLRGVLYPGQERGVNVTDFWRGRFPGFSRTNRDTWPKGRPLLLLNATQIPDGRRLVVGYPPVPAGLLARGQALDPLLKSINLDPNLHKNSPVSLDDYPGAYQLSLAEGVRLSANFPWGFNPGLLHIAHEPSQSPYLKVVDGGVVDNTGIDTLAAVVAGVYQCVKDADAEVRRQAARVIGALEQRGVLLVEIDSGANPGRPGGIARLLQNVFDPIEALAKAGFVNAQNAKLNYFLQFQELLREQVYLTSAERKDAVGTAGAAPEIVPLGSFFQYHCNHSEDVMTAWAMGPDDKAAVLMQFLFEHEKKQDDLKNYLEDLTRCSKIVQAYRHAKKDDLAFAAAFRDFKVQKETFEIEKAVLTFAAAASKDALQGATQQVDQHAGYLIQTQPSPSTVRAKNADPRAAPRFDSRTVQRILKTRKDQLHDKETAPRKPAPAKK